MTQTENPLKKYYRSIKLSVNVPSRGEYYEKGILEFGDDGEIGVYPMTAQDEITLQNPNALLTGQAVVDIMKSCVPSVKQPRKLLACDIDALMIAIRVASYGDEANMDIGCPECTEVSSYTLPLDTLLNQADTLDAHYEVVLDNSLTVFIKPGTFETMVRQQKTAFENTKLEEAINTPTMSDKERMEILSRVFEHMSKLNFDLINEAILKVVFTNDEGIEEEIKNKKHISEWVHNIDKSTVDQIEKKIIDVNKVGIAKTIPAVCSSCDHAWDAAIEFNPVNFS